MTVLRASSWASAQFIFVCQLLLRACSPGKKADREPVAREHARVDGALAAAARQLGATLPTVYRGPYEYSVPGMTEDYLPQTQVVTGARASGARTLSAGTEGRETRVMGVGWPHRLACVTAAATVGLIVAGGLVTNTGRRAGRAGLADDLRPQSCSCSPGRGWWAACSRARPPPPRLAGRAPHGGVSPWRSASGTRGVGCGGSASWRWSWCRCRASSAGCGSCSCRTCSGWCTGCLAQVFFALLVGIARGHRPRVADPGRRAGRRRAAGRPRAVGRRRRLRADRPRARSPRTGPRCGGTWRAPGSRRLSWSAWLLPSSGSRRRTRSWSGGHGP